MEKEEEKKVKNKKGKVEVEVWSTRIEGERRGGGRFVAVAEPVEQRLDHTRFVAFGCPS